MGSLYDIGNFRYKHFTFYQCAETITVTDDDGNEDTTTSTCSPSATKSIIDEQLRGFLDKVWPHKGLFIGDSSEGDFSFVTYVNQATTGMINVQKIYVYKRVRSPVADELLVWEQAIEPQATLKPGVVA